MTSMTVEAVRLTKRYGGRSAVEDVSFTAAQGEIVGLLGPNGAGKTTTIRLLTTVLSPTSGEFSIAGYPSTAAGEIRRSVGVTREQRLSGTSNWRGIPTLLRTALWPGP